MTIKNLIRNLIDRTVNKYGFRLQPTGLGYFNPSDVVPEAKEMNLSLCEYLEKTNKGGVGVRRDFIVEEIFNTVHLQAPNILEIGAGTGMYVEKFLSNYNPAMYEVYETNLNWVAYLKEEYASKGNLKFQHADGTSLHQSASNSVDLLTMHGVTVYIPVILSVNYLNEMYRVCKSGGFIIFDCFTDENFTLSTVNNWLEDTYEYTFPVVISMNLINEFAEKNNLSLVKKFDIQYHASKSTYFIYKKQ